MGLAHAETLGRTQVFRGDITVPSLSLGSYVSEHMQRRGDVVWGSAEYVLVRMARANHKQHGWPANSGVGS